MPQLTAQDIHEVFLKTRKENYTDKVAWGVPWHNLNDKEKLCYDRMAELLNEKVGQPQPMKKAGGNVQECFYHPECKGEGKHQCPKCKNWYCDECHEMFLPIDPMFQVKTAMMCAQCHYAIYGGQINAS